MSTQDNLLIAFTGPSHETALMALLHAIEESGHAILDLDHRDALDRFAAVFVLDAPVDAPVISQLTAVASKHGLTTEATSRPSRWETGKRWVVTVFQPDRSSAPLTAVTKAADRHGFEVVSLRPLSTASRLVTELVLEGPDANAKRAGEPNKAEPGPDPAGDVGALRTDLAALRASAVDCVVQPENLFRRTKRLLVMDMDSTLIQQEVIDELARTAGTYEQVASITARAMNGELGFEASLRARVQTLKGVPTSVFEEVLGRLRLTDGADRLIRILRRLGYRTAVISGGFIQVVDPFRHRIGLDYAFANRLETRDGYLTGGLVGAIVDRARKADLVESLALIERISLDQVITVGDGANDLDMLERAGLGIAFHAKPRVQEAAPHSLNQPGLDTILYLLGISDEEARSLSPQSEMERG